MFDLLTLLTRQFYAHAVQLGCVGGDMGHQMVGTKGAPVTKAVLAELLTRLRRAAVDGAVPGRGVQAHVRRLWLGDAERRRLRDEPAEAEAPVRESVVHAEIDRPDVEKVAPNHGENVFPWLDPVGALLLRYTDADGHVTSRATGAYGRDRMA
ncbi:hypothetical protein [Streptomyces sp. Ru72]|uniref:hypothetical protein n=1 Tax=Streptomyces sp. Ru72 TaxID=2080747 RepID=UPI0011AFD580|nr:hypothetical protein [Streptomyces sp. Ru72]